MWSAENIWQCCLFMSTGFGPFKKVKCEGKWFCCCCCWKTFKIGYSKMKNKVKEKVRYLDWVSTHEFSFPSLNLWAAIYWRNILIFSASDSLFLAKEEKIINDVKETNIYKIISTSL